MKKITYFLTKYFIKTIFLPFLHVNYRQAFLSVATGPKIYTANHPSTLDPIFVMSILKTTVSILITQSAFYLPLIGLILRKSGHIPVIDGQGKLAYQQAKNTLNSGQSILIFPEGDLSHPDGTFRPLYSGAVRLAMETNTPIVPLGLSLQPYKIKTKTLTIKHKTEQARFYLRGKYGLTVGMPINLTGDISDKKKLTQHKNVLSKVMTQLAKQSQTRISPSSV